MPGIFLGWAGAVGKAASVFGWQPYHLHVLTVTKSGILNLLEPLGSAQACTVWGLSPHEGKVLCTHPDWHWNPPSLLHNRYWICPGDKPDRAWHCHPPSSSSKLKERVELYLYPVLGWTLPVPFTQCVITHRLTPHQQRPFPTWCFDCQRRKIRSIHEPTKKDLT